MKGFAGYAYTSTLSREGVEQAVDRAVKLAKGLSASGREVRLASVEDSKLYTVFRVLYS